MSEFAIPFTNVSYKEGGPFRGTGAVAYLRSLTVEAPSEAVAVERAQKILAAWDVEFEIVPNPHVR